MTRNPVPAVKVSAVIVDLDQPPGVQAACDAWLPAAERAAAPARRVARAALRDVLGPTLGRAPGDIALSRQCQHCGDPAHGKPFVPGAAVVFSLTHSGGLAIVASSDAPIALGVDAEQVRPRARLEQLAARVLEPNAYAQWRAAPDDERLVRFLRVWTEKEAYAKARGRGLTAVLAGVPISPPGWWNRSLEVPAGYVASLAADTPDVTLTLSAWKPPPSRFGTGPPGGTLIS